MDSRLEQAKEWAKESVYFDDSSGFASAVRVIQSLPDEWIDAEKLREIIVHLRADMDFNPDLEPHVEALESLLAPPLLTLADMDEDARHALIGKDVNVARWNNPSMLIAVHKNEGAVLGHNWINPWPFVEVRPLSELTPVEWPAQEPRNPENPPAETMNNPSSDTPRNSEEIVKVIRYEKELCLSNQDSSRAMLWRNMERAAGQGEWKDLLNSIRELKLPKDSDTPRNPRPEDVPAGEAWLVRRVNGRREFVALKTNNPGKPWAFEDGVGVDHYADYSIELISRLVPEHKENA